MLYNLFSEAAETDWDYGLTIDAGSTGTRIYVYKWPAWQTGNRDFIEPTFDPGWVHHVSPGVNSYIDRPSDAGASLAPLLDFAVKTLKNQSVLESQFSRFHIYLKATAGMRLLSSMQRDQIIRSLRQTLAMYTKEREGIERERERKGER